MNYSVRHSLNECKECENNKLATKPNTIEESPIDSEANEAALKTIKQKERQTEQEYLNG